MSPDEYKALCVADTMHDFLGGRASKDISPALFYVLREHDDAFKKTFGCWMEEASQIETKVIERFAKYSEKPIPRHKITADSDHINGRLITLGRKHEITAEVLTDWLSTLIPREKVRYVNDFNILRNENFCKFPSSLLQYTLPRVYDLSQNPSNTNVPKELKMCARRNYKEDASIRVQLRGIGSTISLLAMRDATFVEEKGGYGVKYRIPGYKSRTIGGNLYPPEAYMAPREVRKRAREESAGMMSPPSNTRNTKASMASQRRAREESAGMMSPPSDSPVRNTLNTKIRNLLAKNAEAFRAPRMKVQKVTNSQETPGSMSTPRTEDILGAFPERRSPGKSTSNASMSPPMNTEEMLAAIPQSRSVPKSLSARQVRQKQLRANANTPPVFASVPKQSRVAISPSPIQEPSHDTSISDPDEHMFEGIIDFSKFADPKSERNLTLFLIEFYKFTNKDGELKNVVRLAESQIQEVYGLPAPNNPESRDLYLRTLLDFKRMGDFGQVLYCKRARAAFPDTEYVFVSNDRVACAFANTLGVPTILTKKIIERDGSESGKPRGVVLYNFSPDSEALQKRQLQLLQKETQAVEKTVRCLQRIGVRMGIRTRTLTTFDSWMQQIKTDLTQVNNALKKYHAFDSKSTDYVDWGTIKIDTYKKLERQPITLFYLHMIRDLLVKQYHLVSYLNLHSRIKITPLKSFKEVYKHEMTRAEKIKILRKHLDERRKLVPDYLRMTHVDMVDIELLRTSLKDYIDYYKVNLSDDTISKLVDENVPIIPPFLKDLPELTFMPRSEIESFIETLRNAGKYEIQLLGSRITPITFMLRPDNTLASHYIFIYTANQSGGGHSEDMGPSTPSRIYVPSESDPPLDDYDSFMESFVRRLESEGRKTDYYSILLIAAMYQLFFVPRTSQVSQFYHQLGGHKALKTIHTK